jgi:hypothetical protein
VRVCSVEKRAISKNQQREGPAEHSASAPTRRYPTSASAPTCRHPTSPSWRLAATTTAPRPSLTGAQAASSRASWVGESAAETEAAANGGGSEDGRRGRCHAEVAAAPGALPGPCGSMSAARTAPAILALAHRQPRQSRARVRTRTFGVGLRGREPDAQQQQQGRRQSVRRRAHRCWARPVGPAGGSFLAAAALTRPRPSASSRQAGSPVLVRALARGCPLHGPAVRPRPASKPSQAAPPPLPPRMLDSRTHFTLILAKSQAARILVRGDEFAGTTFKGRIADIGDMLRAPMRRRVAASLAVLPFLQVGHTQAAV